MGSRRLAVIAPSRSPIAEPFSGGLEAHVWAFCRSLLERGHELTLFAPPGSDPELPVSELRLDGLRLSDEARSDVSMPPDVAMREHHAYLSLMLELARVDSPYDVVHNHSLHYLPIAMARCISTPILTTLHTPPTPWLESAVQSGPRSRMRFVAVSGHTAACWRPALGEVDVLPNGVDLDRWPVGPGGRDVVWTGRLVPEKAPHLAVLAARAAGRRIALAGPIGDPAYYRDVLAPLLGDDARYVGHLDQRSLGRLVGSAGVAVVTPVWDEPYGLVVAEALACGTPVAGFARGGVPEVVDADCARLVSGVGDPTQCVDALADAIGQAATLSRAAARSRAERRCALTSMMDRYEALLDEVVVA